MRTRTLAVGLAATVAVAIVGPVATVAFSDVPAEPAIARPPDLAQAALPR
jgi:hypothetical protein